MYGSDLTGDVCYNRIQVDLLILDAFDFNAQVWAFYEGAASESYISVAGCRRSDQAEGA